MLNHTINHDTILITTTMYFTGPRSACHSAELSLMIMNIKAWGPQVTKNEAKAMFFWYFNSCSVSKINIRLK